MPIIHIKSLEIQGHFDMPKVLGQISRRFSEDTSIDEEHVTVAWDYFRPGHYLMGGKGGDIFDHRRHQVLVDLLVPDFNGATAVERMMRSVSNTLTQLLELPKESIFIHCRHARPHMVMEGGEIAQW